MAWRRMLLALPVFPTIVKFLVLGLLVAAPAFASVSVKPSIATVGRTFDVVAVDEPLSSVVAALEMHLRYGVSLNLDGDPLITYRAQAVGSERALREVAKSAGLEVKLDDDYYTIFDPAEPTVTLDVKDADVRVILKSMQKECGIRNLVIDPNVNGSGTFLFRELPCRTAFRVVLRSLDLSVISYENDVVAVERRHSH